MAARALPLKANLGLVKREEKSSAAMARARRKFERYFPGAFRDQTYVDWERDYKWRAHKEWEANLGQPLFRSLLKEEAFADIASRAVKIESRRSLLFSFEKMALRDAVRSPKGARLFATGLHEFLHGKSKPEIRFARWCHTLASLPRKQTRVLTWPLATVFGFIAQPDRHIFVKPNTIREAARKLCHDLDYRSPPNWSTYAGILAFAEWTRRQIAVLRPRDMIDIQSFLWVQGSAEYK